MAYILLLEPDPKLAGLYASALRLRQHEVVVVATAQDAIRAADTTKPDVVVMELQLTAHSGIEFLYEFRSYTDWRAVPVIVVSHVPPTEFATSSQLLKRLGVSAYHYKPRTDLRTLTHAIDTIVTVKA